MKKMKMKIEEMKPGTLFEDGGDRVLIKTQIVGTNSNCDVEVFKCVCVYSKLDFVRGAVHDVAKGCEFETVGIAGLDNADDMNGLSYRVRKPVLDLIEDADEKVDEGIEEEDYSKAHTYDIYRHAYKRANEEVYKEFKKYIEEKWGGEI